MMMNRKELLNTVADSIGKSVISENADKMAEHRGRVTARFWPTEASVDTPVGPQGRCLRRIYYNQQGLPEGDLDLATLARFKVGNIIESWVRDMTKKAGIFHDSSVKITYPIPSNPKVFISGEVDLIYKIGNEIIGGEIKSSYGYGFTNFVFHKVTIPGMPKISHTLQVLLYLYYYKFIDKSLGINRFVITYVDRGSMDIIHHCIELSDDLRPIINGIVLKDISNFKNPIYGFAKFNAEKTKDKLAMFEFTIDSIFTRFNSIYDHHESGLLIPRDYDPLFSSEQIEDKFKSGDISKSKYMDYKSGREAFICHDECAYCPYRKKCMEDDKII